MQTITLHNTETEEIIGMIYPMNNTINFNVFFDKIWESFIAFHKTGNCDEFNDGDYSIEDFVDYHNINNPDMKIDCVVNEYIQLSDEDIIFKTI